MARVMTSWVNSRFVVAAVRRELLVTWMTSLLESAPRAKLHSPDTLVDTNIGVVLERLMPGEMSIAEFIRTVWHALLAADLSSLQDLLAQFDGCVTADTAVVCA
jgi:hypothetical protein